MIEVVVFGEGQGRECSVQALEGEDGSKDDAWMESEEGHTRRKPYRTKAVPRPSEIGSYPLHLLPMGGSEYE